MINQNRLSSKGKDRNCFPFQNSSILLFSFLFLFSFSVLAQSETEPPPISIEGGSKHCPYTDISFSIGSVVPRLKHWRVEYQWAFEWGQPGSYLGTEYSGGFIATPRNPGPIQWDREGTFTVSVVVSVYNSVSGGSLVSQTMYDTEITIDATCCGNKLRSIPPLTGNLTVLDEIYYMPDDLTIPSGHKLKITGTVLVEGEAIPNIGPGGNVTGRYFFVEPGAEFEIFGGMVRGHCENMWGGVEMDEDSRAQILDGRFNDSYYGIFLKDGASLPYYLWSEGSSYFNNRRSITSMNFEGTPGRDIIKNNSFSCDPTTFLEPFIYNQGHNIGESFRSEYHVRLTEDYKLDYGSFLKNSFSNSINGVELYSQPSSGYFNYNRMEENHFENIQKIGVYTANREGLFFHQSSSFIIPSEPDINAWQYETYSNDFFPHIPSESVYGIYAENMLELGLVEDGSIESDMADALDFGQIKRIGIHAELDHDPSIYGPLNFTHLFLHNSSIKEMHEGVDISGTTNYAEALSNFFIDNLISLHFRSIPYPFVIGQSGYFSFQQFTCNKFDIQKGPDNFDYVGLQIEDGCVFNNIGFVSFSGGNDPKGNGWALDPNNSPGWNNNPPSTPGMGIDIDQWHVYDNWYSIIDNNPSPSWKYARFNNELLGDNDGKVIPSSITFIDVTNDAPVTQCIASLGIPFPQSRIGSGLSSLDNQEFFAYPNPASQEVHFGNLFDNTIQSIQLTNSKGETWEMTSSYRDSKLDVSNLSDGIYFIRILLESGEVKTTKQVITR